MALVDSDIVKQTAETLLKRIDERAKNESQPAYLKELAEAFALVAANVRSDRASIPKDVGGFA